MNIGLLGCGVVGGGVLALTQDRSDIRVTRVLVRRPKEGLPEGAATCDVQDILNDAAIDTVVEVMGGLHPAYEYVTAAMERGKHVVTANKALIAAYYRELTALAREKGVALRYTAAVGGGIPWLVNLARCKRLDTVCAVGGIMNGTTNFIMDGDDIRRKLCISANIAFDTVLDEETIPTFGIRTVTAADIAAFQAHGFVCKLLAAAERTDRGVCAYVEPTLVDCGEPEAAVPANYNLIGYVGEQVGRQSFFGQGAGRFPTASNVVQDCLTILAGDRAAYTDRVAPVALDLTAEAHPYYVRTGRPDAFLRSVAADTWGAGVVTGAVNTGEMLAWAKRQLSADPACFIAGIR